jgi:cytochrome c6
MRKTIGILVVAGALLALPRGGQAADAATGAVVYAKKCASCHGKQGEGNPGMEKMLKVTIRPLTDKEVQAKSDAQLSKESSEGVGSMKPVKGLTEEDIANVVAHVRTLK